MNRRLFLSALIGTPALAALAAACGDDGGLQGDPSDLGDATTVPSTPVTPYSHPSGADEVVVRIGYEGGFVAPDTIFVNIPNLLISGDGRAIQPGAMIEIYPGPLLAPLRERSIDEAGVQAVLRAADAAGLLGPAPDYSLPEGVGIADAADTVVIIHAGGSTYTHRAYALDIPTPNGTADTPARKNLADFVAAVSDLATVAGADHVGPDAELVAERYRFRATPVDPTQWTDPAPTLVAWPAGTEIVLATAGQCVTADDAAVGSLFRGATQLTFFTEPDGTGTDVTYQIAAVAVLPGDAPC